MPGRTHAEVATLFYLYAQTDNILLDSLELHLSLLQQQGLLASWHSCAILPGRSVPEMVDTYLKSADLILLLVSADFLAAASCIDPHIQFALGRHRRAEARIIPVLLRPCDWSSAPFGALQALPRAGRPITLWSKQDEAFAQVARSLRFLLEDHVPLKRQPSPLSQALAQRNRKRIHQRLQHWYHAFLQNSHQQAALLGLALADDLDAPLAYPVSLLVRNPPLPERSLPAGPSITQVYNEAHQELLILGEPGSGKSTQIYILAQHLLQQAETDQTIPLPFIIPLSSWAQCRLPLADWITEQLIQLYHVPRRLARQWVANQQFIPLLDGLDEMEEYARPLCIAAINTYRQEHLHPLVVCSRSAEYTAASQVERLDLQQTAVVQPLTATQIDAILARGGKNLADLRAACTQNAALRELASVPLLLQLLILTAQNISVQALSSTGTVLQRQVLEHYVQQMVTRKGNPARYPLISTTHWLAFLARQARRSNQTTFTLEGILSSDLAAMARISDYYGAGLKVISGLLSGLLAGLIIDIPFALLFGIVCALFSWLYPALARNLQVERKTLAPGKVPMHSPSDKALSLKQELRRSPRNELLFELPVVLLLLSSGLILALLIVLSFKWLPGLLPRLLSGLHIEPLVVLLFSLLPALLAYLLYRLFHKLGALFFNVIPRLRFWCAGVFPFRATTFLANACAFHLLKRVGDRYQFVHHLLLDYFADLE